MLFPFQLNSAFNHIRQDYKIISLTKHLLQIKFSSFEVMVQLTNISAISKENLKVNRKNYSLSFSFSINLIFKTDYFLWLYFSKKKKNFGLVIKFFFRGFFSPSQLLFFRSLPFSFFPRIYNKKRRFYFFCTFDNVIFRVKRPYKVSFPHSRLFFWEKDSPAQTSFSLYRPFSVNIKINRLIKN